MNSQVKIGTNIAKDDELKAMAAMFQQQTANWEETQEKMSQLVSRLAIFVLRSTDLSNEHSYLFFVFFVTHSAQRIYSNPRGGGPGGRGGKPYMSHHADRPLPPSYVCYRCGQKGWHFR